MYTGSGPVGPSWSGSKGITANFWQITENTLCASMCLCMCCSTFLECLFTWWLLNIPKVPLYLVSPLWHLPWPCLVPRSALPPSAQHCTWPSLISTWSLCWWSGSHLSASPHQIPCAVGRHFGGRELASMSERPRLAQCLVQWVLVEWMSDYIGQWEMHADCYDPQPTYEVTWQPDTGKEGSSP